MVLAKAWCQFRIQIKFGQNDLGKTSILEFFPGFLAPPRLMEFPMTLFHQNVKFFELFSHVEN